MMFELPQVRYVDVRLYRELLVTEARVIDYCSKIKRSIKEENTSSIESEWRTLDCLFDELIKIHKKCSHHMDMYDDCDFEAKELLLDRFVMFSGLVEAAEEQYVDWEQLVEEKADKTPDEIVQWSDAFVTSEIIVDYPEVTQINSSNSLIEVPSDLSNNLVSCLEEVSSEISSPSVNVLLRPDVAVSSFITNLSFAVSIESSCRSVVSSPEFANISSKYHFKGKPKVSKEHLAKGFRFNCYKCGWLSDKYETNNSWNKFANCNQRLAWERWSL